MPDSIDDTIFSVSAFDDFSDTLDDLERHLGEVEASAERVDPVDIDAAVADAMADLQALDAMVESIDDDVTIDVDVDDDFAHAGFSGGMFGPETQSEGLDWSDKSRVRESFPSDQRLWELMGIHDAGVLEGVHQRESPFGPDWDVGEVDERGNFRAAPGLLAEGAAGDVAKDLVQAQAEATDIFEREGESRWDPLTEAVDEFKSLRLSMGMFMNLMASLLPLLGVFVGALPAAIAGVGALAAAALAAGAALYGLAGLGVIGLALEDGEFNFQQLQSRIQDMLDSFISAFGPLANAIEPMMLDLMENVEMAMFGVAQQMRPLLNLTDDARSMFNALLGMIGPFAERGIQFAHAMMPMIQFMGQVTGQIDLFGLLADIIQETVPLLWTMFSIIGRSLPAIYEMSVGFLAVATAITGFFGGLLQLINVFPFFAKGLGMLIALTFTAITATALYSLATGVLAKKLLAVAAGFFKAVIPATYDYVVAQTSATTATIAFSIAAAALLGIITFGLAPALSSMTTGFDLLGSDIQNAADSLREFNRVGRRSSFPTVGGMEDGAYTKPATSGAGTSGTAGGSNTTVVAPDEETATAAGHTISFLTDGSSETVEESDVNNRLHSK